ncbi:MAG: glycosyltransferase family 2 protein [Opitutales bacterium]|nr:glycosyltransferase family 2 protein [Opitutales bacterium]
MKTLELIISLPLLLTGAYLFFLTATVLIRRQSKFSSRNRKCRSLIVVVPAHNEESVITKCLSSIKMADQEGISLQLAVIADNCEDATVERSLALADLVWERVDPDKKGKGHAIQAFLRKHQDRVTCHDLIIFLDADTIVQTDYFMRIVRSYESQSWRVAQTFYDVENVTDHWRTKVATLALSVSHYLRPLARSLLGGSAGLKGNGMVFSSELILQTGWESHSIVEDMEQSINLARDGHSIAYVKDARCLAEMPMDRKSSSSQRRRWEQGRWLTIKHHVPRLLLEGIKKRSWLMIECCLDLIFPPMSLIVMLAIPSLMLGWVFGWVIPVSAIFFLTSLALAIGISVSLSHGFQQLCSSLLLLPIYLFEKICFYLSWLKKGTAIKEWIRTGRNAEHLS